MPPTCNIDARGKAVRLIWGVACLIAGMALLVFWAWPAGTVLPWSVTALVIGGGLLGVYEARAGWCVVRAMGFKTPV